MRGAARLLPAEGWCDREGGSPQARGRLNGARSSERDRREDRGQGGYAREVLERRRRSVLTCERGLRTALASGDERLAQKWSRAIKDAEERLIWAEADIQAARTGAQSGFAS